MLDERSIRANERCSRCRSVVDATGRCGGCLLASAMAQPEPPDLDGGQFGSYRIGALLGKGGLGVVYAAVDTKPTSPRYGRTVALKIPVEDREAPDQLVREAQLAGSLRHEHIVPVYEVDDQEGITYFTLMLVDGGPLEIAEPVLDAPRPGLGWGFAWLKRRVAMTRHVRRAAEIALKIARAVAFAHRHGILHRDLKPANVLVDRESGQPLV